MKKAKIVISDCHLSAGIIFDGKRNPHEDFFFDDEMVEFLEYFSTGEYGQDCEMELIINGDFFDFLNISYKGEFVEAITEELALYKLDAIMAGHIKVIEAFRQFVEKPGKSIIYNLGNHDADMFFPRVREKFIRTVDPQGRAESPVVRVNSETPVIDVPGGIQIEHGNNYEAVHVFNYQKPLLTDALDEPVLNIPWGSFYVMKISNRFRWERDYVDKVRPIKAMFFWGLLFDTWFTIRFMFLSAFYFMKTRFIYSPKRRSRLLVTLKILQQETTTFLQDLEEDARTFLDQNKDKHTIIMGHTHHPMFKTYPDGKTYINTGSWTRMINLNLRGWGSAYRLNFALIRYKDDGTAYATLEQWMGHHRPHRPFIGG